jgi:hypothetical protein
MKKWTTALQVKVKNNQITSDPIRIQRGIYQGDSLSPLWICLALDPLSYLLNRTNCGFGINSNNQETQRLNNLLYVDDIILYAATNNQLQELLQLAHTFSRDIGMTFGIEKCKTLSIVKRKLVLGNFTTEEEDTVIAMKEEDIYKYLGHMQTEQIRHSQMEQELGDEYLQRTKDILKTKLNGKNTFKAINTYAIPVLTFSFGIVKRTPTDLENIQIRTRALLTRRRIRRPRAAKQRLTLPRRIGGRGMADRYNSAT